MKRANKSKKRFGGGRRKVTCGEVSDRMMIGEMREASCFSVGTYVFSVQKL